MHPPRVNRADQGGAYRPGLEGRVAFDAGGVERICRVLFARVGNRPDAEDLTGEVFVAALPRLRKEPMMPFELQAWLGRRSPQATQYYVKITPTTPTRASPTPASGAV